MSVFPTGSWQDSTWRLSIYYARKAGIRSCHYEDFALSNIEYFLFHDNLIKGREHNTEELHKVLSVVIYRKAIDWVRKQRLLNTFEMPWPQHDGIHHELGLGSYRNKRNSQQIAMKIYLQIVMDDILKRLTESQRQLYYLQFIELYSIKEISEIFEKSENSVRQQILVLRRQLIASLDRRGENYESLRDLFCF